MKTKLCACMLIALGGLVPSASSQAQLISDLSIWGEATDLTAPPPTTLDAEKNRLGGIGSAIWYDQASSVLYAMPDSGPGGGLLPWETRIQKFSLNVDSATGALSNLNLTGTIRFKTEGGSQPLTGLTPIDPLVLGNAFDPEGMAMAPDGTFYVGDEYGPSIYQFALTDVGATQEARFLRALSVPDRWKPIDANGQVNYASSDLASGRQSGRGIEAFTISPDGNTLYAMLQCPLVDEGGRKVRNVRLATLDVATGNVTGEFVYQLESIDSINQRVPDATFSANQQGRNISSNALYALSDTELLVLERDNRGIGVGNPTGADATLSTIGTKRVYKVDLSGATNVSGIALPASGELPAEVTAVSKSLYLDIDLALKAAGRDVVEKFESLSLVPLTGPQPYAMLIATDNDYSLLDVENSETGEIELFDVLTDGTQVPINTPLAAGQHLLPSYVYSFAVPEPSTLTLLLTVLGVCAVFRRIP